MLKNFPAPLKTRRPVRALAMAAGLSAAGAGLGGCEVDSFFDQSVIGRWEHTPTIMPIQTRIASIEDDTGEYVRATPVQPGDLVPDADEHRFTPGDVVEIRIRDFFQLQAEERFERIIDRTGYIDITRLGSLQIEGKTVTQSREMIEEAIRNARIQDKPVVTVTPLQLRRQTFSMLGAVQNPGQYFISTRDYRLLEGITAAGGINETIPSIFVIRQEYVGAAPPGVTRPTQERPRRWQDQQPERDQQEGQNLIDLIDDLTKPAPAVVGHRDVASAAPVRAALRQQPPIDIPDSTARPTDRVPEPASPRTTWQFVNGQWVQNGAPVRLPEDADPLSGAGGETQVVQRVIEVPFARCWPPADVNIVLRPSDVVRIPPPRTGLVYINGAVGRPGPYGLPSDGRLTLLRALTSAGGLNGLAVPERVDLTRVVGKDRQATIRLNLRAIAEQTQPDIYLKPDDMINVGTAFWAYPLAIIRGGFRASYGFGFILDRNFAGNVFGADRSFNNN